MSQLHNEISALIALRDLYKILPGNPVNLGKSYVMGLTIFRETINRKGDFDKIESRRSVDCLEYFQQLFIYIANYIPLNSLFYTKDAKEIIGDIIADIIRNTEYGDHYLPKIDKKVNLKIQNFLNQIILWGNGRCYNYASLALYHILESGIRPVDALWLIDPLASRKKNKVSGHQVIAIGLKTDDAYLSLIESDPIIVDFWSGSILPASKYFLDEKFKDFDKDVIQCCRIRENEPNPFQKSYININVPMKIKEWKETTATSMIDILNDRKRKGELIPEFNLDETLIKDSREANANVLDLEFNDRILSIKKNLLKLNLFEKSATKIQKKYKEYKRTKPNNNI